jgi:ubiquinone/menaquinone biosynthesis C-methylase UbiE/GNAT superfamily N-acetyltransferase
MPDRPITVVQADSDALVATARTLIGEYADALGVDLEYQGFAAELAGLPAPYAAPDGALLIAFVGDDVAGCACLRRLDDRAGEMKRLFVRPDFRSHGVGATLINAVMRAAVASGYAELRLDTLPQMTAAQTLYRRLGFVEIPPYSAAYLPGTRFFALTIRGNSDNPPAPNELRFDDGAAYERYMGVWSQRVGDTFLDWLSPRPGLRWLDVGCGNGAFTETLISRCAPTHVAGIDPSEAQLAFARSREALRDADFRRGDAMALPFADNTFDIAIMPLVIFFVPEPARGVAEMTRVVSAGGSVTAYAWDMIGGGFPYAALHDEMRAMGIAVPTPPSPDASRVEALHDLWTAAGLESVEVRQMTVQRTFENFEDYWTTVHGGPSVRRQLGEMPGKDRTQLRARMEEVLAADGDGRITCHATANAVRGRVA